MWWLVAAGHQCTILNNDACNSRYVLLLLLLLLIIIIIIIIAIIFFYHHNYSCFTQPQHTHGGVVRHQDYLAGFSERGMSLPRVFSILLDQQKK
jgi:hypothetical protein